MTFKIGFIFLLSLSFFSTASCGWHESEVDSKVVSSDDDGGGTSKPLPPKPLEQKVFEAANRALPADLDFIKAEVEKGFNVDSFLGDKKDKTLLMIAVTSEKVDLVRFFLELGASIELANSAGETALSIAATDVIREFLENFGKPQGFLEEEFFTAVKSGAIKDVKKYIGDDGETGLGAKIDHIDDEGKTALIYATINADSKIAKFLIRKGTTLMNHKDKSGKSASAYAKEGEAQAKSDGDRRLARKFTRLLKLFKQAGAN